MRAVDRGDEFILEDSPGLYWFLGLMLIGVGAVFVITRLDLMSVIFGACGVIVGFWWLHIAPRTRVVVSRSTGKVRISRIGLLGRSVHALSASDIAAVRVSDRKDDEDKDVFQIQLVLRSGETEPVSRLWTLGRDTMECARRLSEALEVPLA